MEDLALDVVGRTVARVSAEEHMANYQAARALIGNGKSSAKKGARKSAVKEGTKRCDPSPTPISAFPLSPIRRWFR